MIIRREAMLAALAATTADDSRYFLNGIRAEPGAHRVIGTDGHVLLIATDTSPFADADFPSCPGATFHGDPEAPITLPADICKAMIGTMPKRSVVPILACAQLGRNGSDSSVTLAATDLAAPRVATIKTDECQTFPTYQRILDAHAGRESVTLTMGVDILETLIKAAKAIAGGTGKNAHIPAIRFEIPCGPKDLKDRNVATGAGITITGPDVTVTGVAMPCRA